MNPNVKPSKVYPIAGAIRPQSVAKSTAKNTGWIQVPAGSKWVIIRTNAGVVDSGTWSVDLLQATSSGGAGSKAFKSAVITHAAANVSTEYEAVIDDMDINNGFAFLEAVATTDANVAAGALISLEVAFGPAELMA